MQVTINEHSIIHCERIMQYYNKDDEESKLLIMWFEEQSLILLYTRCYSDQKGIGGKWVCPHTAQHWVL